MKDFIASEDRELLQQHGLASFDALWALQLEPVDEPNTERGGHSIVCRLELDDRAFYLKRQTNHLTRSLLHPFGEPTFAREMRNIQHYNKLGIPALEAAFFAARKMTGESRAILLTRALDGWCDLDSLLANWHERPEAQRKAVLQACGELARCLHMAGQMHGCFYPKHIFLQAENEAYRAQLIDLEKTRPLLFGKHDRVKDLEPLLRRTSMWSEVEVRQFLLAYLGSDAGLDGWIRSMHERGKYKRQRK